MDETREFWITKEMFSQGWHELRNGIVYHRDYTLSQVVRRDQYGNYLVRVPVPKSDRDDTRK